MICSICEEVSQVPTDTRIPTAFINTTLWDRRLESGRQRELDLSSRGSAAASQADANSRGENLPREQRRYRVAVRRWFKSGPPQPKFLLCQLLPQTLQPSEFVIFIAKDTENSSPTPRSTPIRRQIISGLPVIQTQVTKRLCGGNFKRQCYSGRWMRLSRLWNRVSERSGSNRGSIFR